MRYVLDGPELENIIVPSGYSAPHAYFPLFGVGVKGSPALGASTPKRNIAESRLVFGYKLVNRTGICAVAEALWQTRQPLPVVSLVVYPAATEGVVAPG